MVKFPGGEGCVCVYIHRCIEEARGEIRRGLYPQVALIFIREKEMKMMKLSLWVMYPALE